MVGDELEVERSVPERRFLGKGLEVELELNVASSRGIGVKRGLAVEQAVEADEAAEFP